MNKRSSLPVAEPDVDFAPLGYHKSQEGRSIDIVRFAISIWKYLVGGLVLGCGMGALAYLYMGPVYVAGTKITVSKKATVGETEARLYGGRSEHISAIKSDEVVRIAYEKYGLKEIFGKDKDPLKSIWENLVVVRESGQETSFDNILNISFTSADKDEAKKVVSAVIDAYADWLEAKRGSGSQLLYKTLLDQKRVMDEERTRLEDEYEKWRGESPFYISSSPVVSAQGVATSMPSPYQANLQDLVTRRNLNRDQLRKTKIKIDQLKEMMANPEERETLQAWIMNSISSGSSGGPGAEGGSSGGGLLSSPTGKMELDQQLLTARLLERRLLLVLGPNHADVRNVRRQIETILDFYHRQGLTPPNLGSSDESSRNAQGAAGADLAQTYLTILKSRLQELEDEQLRLAEDYKEAEKTAKEASSYEVIDQRYKDDIARKKKELDAVLTQITNFDLNKDQEGYTLSRTNDVRVDRSMKRVMKIVGACGVLGLLSVFCLAYFREWYDTTLKTAEETRSVIGAAVMGAIPHFRGGANADRLAIQNGLSPALVYYHRPGSREAEAYRSSRTTLYHSTKDSQDKIIQITSAEPGDGKSTTAANLAIAIAQSGKKVLLIDADLRRPTMHTLFALPQDIGLTDVLLSEVDWFNAVRSTRLENLSVLTAGLCPSNPAELLSSSRLPDMLSAARNSYDVIIIDTPPILAVSDPAIISPHIDGLIMVVRMGKNKRAAAERAREMIDAHGIRLYGVIINDIDYSVEDGVAYSDYDKYYDATTPSLPTQTSRELVSGQK
ncbi:MAG: polysaccharide biosynthesis tyrosine autokinase [Planctomycetaceae bacterium]